MLSAEGGPLQVRPEEVGPFKVRLVEVGPLQVQIGNPKGAWTTLFRKPGDLGSGEFHCMRNISHSTTVKRPFALPMVRLCRPAVEVALQFLLSILADRVASPLADCLWMRTCAGCLLLAHRSLLSLAMPSLAEAANVCMPSPDDSEVCSLEQLRRRKEKRLHARATSVRQGGRRWRRFLSTWATN